MSILLKVIPDTAPEPTCHVYFLTPLSENLITESLNVILETKARELWLPRLPMLSSGQVKEKNNSRSTTLKKIRD